MSKSTYIPRPGSVAARLLQHMQQHPAAELTVADVAKLVGCSHTTVQICLQAAVNAKLLTSSKKFIESRTQWHYTAGPALAAFDLTAKPANAPKTAATTAAVAQAAPPTTAALCQYGTYCSATDTLTLNAQQRERLCLVIGAYMLSAANVLEAAA